MHRAPNDDGRRMRASSTPSYHEPTCDATTRDACLARKSARIIDALRGVTTTNGDALFVERAVSNVDSFRSRARFQIVRRTDGDGEDDADGSLLSYAMWDGGGPNVMVEDFPMATEEIRRAMPRTLCALRKRRRNIVRDGLEAAHFLASVWEGSLLITLVYSKPIDAEEWLREAREMCAEIGERVEMVGRSKGVVARTGRDHVVETYELGDDKRLLSYKHTEGAFSNPNRDVTIATMDFLCSCARSFAAGASLLEMYCGNGNHTCAMASEFKRIVAVEINPKLVDAARESCAMNGVTNAEIVLADSQHVSKRLARGQFTDATGASVSPKDFAAILVDPPRAGLDDDTLKLVAEFEHVLYVSCGPENFFRNFETGLCKKFAIERFIILDHFPYTQHVEIAAYMKRVV